MDAHTRRRLTRLPELRGHLVTSAAGAALGAAATLAQAVLLARLIAALAGGTPPTRALLVGLAGTVVARGLLTAARQAAAARAAARVTAGLRGRVLAAGQRRASSRRGGELLTLVDRGIDGLTPYLRDYLPQLATATAVPLAVLGWLCLADPVSALVVAVTLPLVPLFGALVGWHTASLTRRRWRRLSRLGGYFLDVLAGLPTLRAFGRAGDAARRLREVAAAHRRATVATLRVAFLSALVGELVAALSLALVAVPIGLRLLSGDLDLTTGLTVLLAAPEAYLPLRALGARFHAGAAGLAAAEEAFAVLDADPPARGGPRAAPGAPSDPGAAVPRPGDGTPREPGRATATPARRTPRMVVAARADSGRVAPARHAPGATVAGPAASGRPVLRLDDVTVWYPDRVAPALEHLDLTVAAGEHVVLTGPSGAGKSTVLAAVLGLVTAASGRVLVGDPPVDPARAGDAELAAWRRRVAWVPQRPRLFAGTVADNIRLGAPDASDAAVWAAAEAAHAADFVAVLPDGLHTRVGDGGRSLSAGQRQRLALARAFCRQAPIVLLDEPTARLDTGTEAAVLAATERLTAGRTVLAVAHRPAMIATGLAVPLSAGRRVRRQVPA